MSSPEIGSVVQGIADVLTAECKIVNTENGPSSIYSVSGSKDGHTLYFISTPSDTGAEEVTWWITFGKDRRSVVIHEAAGLFNILTEIYSCSGKSRPRFNFQNPQVELDLPEHRLVFYLPQDNSPYGMLKMIDK
ncbi:MAG: hypothetical protein UV55_C0043G0001 [Candidatus Gottesmanbacteria bacterium GW2011_GWC1_43_10]|nr:MAG: hypothetical protein UV55_C0043G0001 [Candidatus Gottesmanbacteria bacterium GW2011_GWC1_43_10]OGG23553.1 MAG: hypothetical protein A3A59_02310 [Candidatus Gottesmanbacteria bacterium RIFCSPLOWO2_01_FULL_42_10]HCM38060.1 hypothetical protein [Patescibacteria group bacterium]